jgi:predicted nucleic acid-binding protein
VKRIFLDANVLYAAARKPGRTLDRLITSGRAQFVTCPYAALEAERNLEASDRPQLAALLQSVQLVPDAFGPPPAGVGLRGKDIPILASAAPAQADLLVTSDGRDFGKLFGRTLGGVKIIATEDFPDSL